MLEKIIELRNQGLKWSDIDIKLGTQKGTSWARAKRAGLIKSKPKWLPEHRDFLIANRNTLGLKKCAEELGFKYDFIRKKSAEISKDYGRMKGFPVDKSNVSFMDNEIDLFDWIYIETGQTHFNF